MVVSNGSDHRATRHVLQAILACSAEQAGRGGLEMPSNAPSIEPCAHEGPSSGWWKMADLPKVFAAWARSTLG